MNSNFFFTLVGLIIAVFAICNINVSKTTESFLPPMTAYQTLEVKPTNAPAYSLQNNLLSTISGDKFVKVSNMQSLLSPRFSNINYGANIKYNTPDYKNLGVPCTPTTFSNMAQENYQSKENYCNQCNKGGNGCGSVTCKAGGIGSVYKGGEAMMPSDYAAGDYNEVADKLYQSGGGSDTISDGLLPVGTMQTIDSEGQVVEPVMYSRLMFANQKSNLHAQGDFIRGDLPITPCDNGWFNVSVKPSKDLNRGAMSVMGGLDNGTTQAMANLIYDASGRTETTISGYDMSNQFEVMAGGQPDGMPVTVTLSP